MTLKIEKIKVRPDYVEEVYRVLADAISDGSLAPGTRLTQEEIAEQFAVSRSPVLQALRLLKKDGLVQDAPGRGVLVAPLDAEWTGQLYQVRGALDALAAKLAAERGAVIDSALIKRGRLVSKGKDVKAMIDADIAFHQAIYEASGNPLIVESAQLHWVHLRRVMGAVLQSSRLRDPARAAELTELHTSSARQNLVARLGEMLKTG
jgi:DNA-binding GntR family transcriptional regulator